MDKIKILSIAGEKSHTFIIPSNCISKHTTKKMMILNCNISNDCIIVDLCSDKDSQLCENNKWRES